VPLSTAREAGLRALTEVGRGTAAEGLRTVECPLTPDAPARHHTAVCGFETPVPGSVARVSRPLDMRITLHTLITWLRPVVSHRINR
jgi:hypothetical protein